MTTPVVVIVVLIGILLEIAIVIVIVLVIVTVTVIVIAPSTRACNGTELFESVRRLLLHHQWRQLHVANCAIALSVDTPVPRKSLKFAATDVVSIPRQTALSDPLKATNEYLRDEMQ